jgi:hypothetical protein
MSWHFSQALVEAYSADTSSAGAPSAPLSGSDTRETFCSHAKTTDACRSFRSGTTCKPLTDDLGEALLTWFRADSLAKTSAQPEKAQESTESAAECGRTWPESFARWDRDTASWKTPQCSLLAGLDKFSETWPRWGMMRGGECSVQSMPAHLTSETESGLWPTPTVCGNYNRKGASANSGDGLATAVRTWPTPTAHNAKETNAPSESQRNTPTLAAQVGGQLNPTWVEWLMGWPLGWTDLKQSETDKFRAWRRLHGCY